jgi:Uma2 family endonuclease
LVWEVDPKKRIVSVYSLPDQPVVFTEADTLDGGAVLPGLTLPVARIFQRVRRQDAPGKTQAKSKKKGSR